MDARTVNHLGMIEAAASMAPIHERPMSHTDENCKALPQRLRGRGDFLLKRGHIKDAELMFDAATEIEALRALADSEGTRAVEYLRRAWKAEEALREPQTTIASHALRGPDGELVKTALTPNV